MVQATLSLAPGLVAQKPPQNFALAEAVSWSHIAADQPSTVSRRRHAITKGREMAREGLSRLSSRARPV